MKNSLKGLLVCLLVVTAVAVVSGGCAEERPALDRVQPYALPKAFFVGEDLLDPSDNPEFWSQATLVDVGYGASQDGLFTSTYAQPMSRVKWEITEDMLIARLAYERVEGSDGKGAGKETPDGVIVAAFDIDKHFDVVWAYNPTTGEKLNIKEENDFDRPWYEREYFRVDFSKNLNTDGYDFDTLSLLGIFGGIEYESLAYYVDDPNHPDAPYFDYDKGYFDITNKAFAKPGVIDLSHLGWGIDSFPACFLDPDFLGGTSPVGSCSPVELTIRHSFRAVEDLDYEPQNWDGYRFQAFGAFYTERKGFARNYGMSDEQWHRMIDRYPIWEWSHYYKDPQKKTGAVECFTPQTTKYGLDPHRDDNGDGTEDECTQVTKDSGTAGSRCDTFSQKCTLPFRDRVPVVTAWYYSQGGNPEYFDATALAAHEWDVALRTAVRTAQYTECVKTGGKECAKDYPMYFGQQDDNGDAVALALEVDDCRNGLAYADLKKDPKKCAGIADKIGKERGYSEGVISIAKMDEMLVLCHSPVQADDHPACGAGLPDGWDEAECAKAKAVTDEELRDVAKLAQCDKAIRVRRGDLRYHQVNVITEPQVPSPWGIYTDAHDPLTGMTVSASINVWSHITDLWSQKVVDMIRYHKGELSTADITEGENVYDWAQAAEAAAGGGALPRLTRDQVEERLGEFTRGFKAPVMEEAAAFKNAHPEAVEAAANLNQEMTGVMAAYDAATTTAPLYLARRQAAKGSEMEASLMNKMMQQLSGIEGMPMSDGLMDLVSPLRGGNPSMVRDLRNMKENALAERGACILHEAEAPLGLAGLADVLEQKFGKLNATDSPEVQQARAEKMRKYVAGRAHYSVIAHEMGHSMGLRHNFVSSSDAWNFRPQYWQLRTSNGNVTKQCSDLSPDGKTCVGPRWFDPVTTEEKANLIWMFMHSSIMEYPGETTQDFLGLGAHDFAAARMLYGDSVAVYSDPSYVMGTDRAETALAKMDNFGGIMGISHRFKDETIHYSRLQELFDLIKGCKVVNANQFKPGRWDNETMGQFSPLLDALLVNVSGAYSRCGQQAVDYVTWDSLRSPSGEEFGGYYRGGGSMDDAGRLRVPYGFATDRWADLGNLSVYRHDNGADAYEIFNFLITQQEVNHVFDNYRRGRQEFSVRGAADRNLTRYNTKLRDGAKGLGLLRNVYKDFAVAMGYDFDGFWPAIAPMFFSDNILASGMVFDHFTRMASRPQAGNHYREKYDLVLRSAEDAAGEVASTDVIVPNGATGFFGAVAPGGRPVENRLAGNMGEYDSELTVNAGSYYDKISVAMLMTESVDNFISDSREDFVDARYRAVSLADLFPDGYRRFLGNLLTGDDYLKGPRIASKENGVPLVDTANLPSSGIGWTTWWSQTPESCFPSSGTAVCDSYGTGTKPFKPKAPAAVTVLDPQLGWEVQKFFIAWTLLYLPENQQQHWLDMMRIWELGKDADPGFENRIEFHNPQGKVYVAKTFGTEKVFGRTVEKGIAARMLQYANELMAKAYTTEDGPDINGDGAPDWYLPKLNPDTGEPLVKYDSTIAGVEGGFIKPTGTAGCDKKDNSKCTCTDNRACMQLQKYVEVPFYLRQALDAYGLVDPQQKGLYE